MKNTLRLLLLLAAFNAMACGNEKKKRTAPVSENPSSPTPALSDSMPQDRTAVAPAPADSNATPQGTVEQPYDTINEYLYKGLMVWKDNVGEFVDCGNQRSYYVNDLTKELKAKYYSFEVPENGPLYVEVVGIYVRPRGNAPKRFKRQMNITHLNVMQRDVPFNCGGALSKIKEGK